MDKISNSTEASQRHKGHVIAIVAMFFLFAMISFVTNLAAPIGTIWKNNYDWSGMLGNMMNFLAYLFMGIPAGNLLVRIGYKRTAQWAMIVGLMGLLLQWLSGVVGVTTGVFEVGGETVTLNFLIYLLGAFICGFSVCMLNTVVNPMLNMLGGGGNKGNQRRNFSLCICSVNNMLNPDFPDSKACNQQNNPKHQRSNTFMAFVPIVVLSVSVLSGNLYPNPGDNCGKNIR